MIHLSLSARLNLGWREPSTAIASKLKNSEINSAVPARDNPLTGVTHLLDDPKSMPTTSTGKHFSDGFDPLYQIWGF